MFQRVFTFYCALIVVVLLFRGGESFQFLVFGMRFLLMKILMIIVVCGRKSTGIICTDLADELTSRGHIVKIAYGREEVPEQYEKYAVRIGNDIDVFLHALMSRVLDSCGFHSTYYTKKFIKWIEEYNPDVIHIHNIHGYYVNVKILFEYLRKGNKRIIWTLHDCCAFTGHFALCDGDNCEKWKCGCGKCPQNRVYPKSFIDRSKSNWRKKKIVFSGISELVIVTPSRWLEDHVKNSFLSDYSTMVINNGIDTNKFYPSNSRWFCEKYGIEGKFIILGVATNWSDQKGYGDFINLSTKLDDNYKIVLVGVENRLITDEYPNLLTVGLTIDIQELVDIYSVADVFVNLTYCDTYPTVNIEARACGVPIITYDTGGSPDAAGDDVYAIVPGGDINSIYDQVVRLRLEQGKCKHVVSGSIRQALSNKVALKQYVELILDGYTILR